MGLVAVIINRIRADFGLIVAGFSFLAAAAIFGLGWLAVSVLLPRTTNDPGAVLPGAVLVGATIAGMQSVSQLYLPDHLARITVDGGHQTGTSTRFSIMAVTWASV